MSHRLRFCLLFIIVSLVACSSLNTRPLKDIDIGQGVTFSLLPVLAVDRPVIVTQQVVITFNGERHTLISTFEVSQEKFVVVGVTPVGVKIFSAELSDQSLEWSSLPVLPSQFDAKYLLADVQLVHWPIQALQSALAPSNVLVQQQGLHRVVVAKGKNIIEMDLQGEGPWYDHVEYRHLQRGYALFIDTLSVSPL